MHGEGFMIAYSSFPGAKPWLSAEVFVSTFATFTT